MLLTFIFYSRSIEDFGVNIVINDGHHNQVVRISLKSVELWKM